MTKAETLELLASRLTAAKVLPQIRLTRASAGEASMLVRAAGWMEVPLIVRSSARCEDREGGSMAGKFKTVAGVLGGSALAEAVAAVFASYGEGDPTDQALIQPMLASVEMSGVAFTREPSTGGPYVVINYDDSSGRTDSVTGGGTNEIKTYYHARASRLRAPAPLDRVVELAIEAERELGARAADVEFALCRDGELYLLQARPLAVAVDDADPAGHLAALDRIHGRVVAANRSLPYLHGERAVYGVMPDWNPAEIVGVRPRPLALSLYKELVTDSIWAYQRDNYGYKNLRSFPLIQSFAGLPYVDVRVSLNSFVPADLDDGLASRLVNHYIDKLVAVPSHHDKVEFEVIHSCYTLDLPDRLKPLLAAGFSPEDVRAIGDSLRRLTNAIVHGETGLWRRDAEKIVELERRFERVRGSTLSPLAKMYWLIEDCKRYGTLPFAGLARAGFIAAQTLKSLVSVGILRDADVDDFMASLDSVSSRMMRDIRALSREEFLRRYGHLRPGTYDILSPRYDENPDRYFDWEGLAACGSETRRPFRLSLSQLKETESLLKSHGLAHDAVTLFDFLRGAIEGREYAKFVFTRHLSEILAAFGRFGAENGAGLDDCSYADIDIIRRLYSSTVDERELLARSISEGRASYALTRSISLPPLITDAAQVWGFHLPEESPNFITLKCGEGPVASAGPDRTRLKGAIVFMPSADPGYDWIFSHGIAGFVTKYGGANSHMAVRAGELGLPAVIGAGEQLYARWSRAKLIRLDCAGRRVQVLA